jgi:hypothetical protein
MKINKLRIILRFEYLKNQFTELFCNCTFIRLNTFLLFIIVGSFLNTAEVHAKEPVIEVSEAVWTNGVENKNYLEKYDGTAPLGELYLWMRITCKKKALEFLKDKGKIPIRHKWYRCIGHKLLSEKTPKLIDAINLSIGKKEKIEKIEMELNERGFFDWRTWSMKRNMRRGVWYVYLVYGDGKAVLCDDGMTKCVFKIKVE